MVTEVFTNTNKPLNPELLALALVARQMIAVGAAANESQFTVDDAKLGSKASECLSAPFNASVNGKIIQVEPCSKPICEAINDAMYRANGSSGMGSRAPAFKGIQT